MSDMDDVFNANGTDAEQGQAAQPAPVVEAQPAPQPAPEPQGVIEGAPPAPVVEEQRHVPISAILDEREKRQQYQREAEELRRWKAEREAQEQTKPKDFYEDPDGYLRNVQQQQQHAIWNERLNMSEMMAVNKHGDETVTQAADAFKQAAAKNPALVHEFTQQRDPYGFVVQWHKRNAALTEIGEDPAAYKERIRTELMAELQAQQPAPAVQQSAPRIPGSLSQAPSAGKSQQAAPSSFNSMFAG